MNVIFKLLKKFQVGRFRPQTVSYLRRGYAPSLFLKDLAAGLTVGIVAFPMAMAFAIASGLSPEVGLYTAIVAGFLNALFGGGAFQIGGPTGSFIVVVTVVIARHGFHGLTLAMCVASGLLILMAVARFGALLKLVSYPVITGFTAGIAVLIFSSQIKELLGLEIEGTTPPTFLLRWQTYFDHLGTWNPQALLIGSLSLAAIFLIRRLNAKLPYYLIVAIISSFIVWFFDIPVATIGSSYGKLSSSMPSIGLPSFSFDALIAVIPDAVTIALLVAIESLLSAAVADGVAGTTHNPDAELMAQGIANFGSALIGGIPSTGGISRTITSIRMGAQTPFAGMIAAIMILGLMLLLGRYAAHIPLATLAAILIAVAWAMSDLSHIKAILRSPVSDIVVMGITFLLTVILNLTVAVEVGIILSAFAFLRKMAERTTLMPTETFQEEAEATSLFLDPDVLCKKNIPDGTTVYDLNGPLFFGATHLFKSGIQLLDEEGGRVLILRMRRVPWIDASGMRALREFETHCRKRGITLLLSGINPSLKKRLEQARLHQVIGKEQLFSNINDALKRASELLPAAELT